MIWDLINDKDHTHIYKYHIYIYTHTHTHTHTHIQYTHTYIHIYKYIYLQISRNINNRKHILRELKVYSSRYIKYPIGKYGYIDNWKMLFSNINSKKKLFYEWLFAVKQRQHVSPWNDIFSNYRLFVVIKSINGCDTKNFILWLPV